MESINTDIIMYIAKLSSNDDELLYMILSKISRLSLSYNNRFKSLIIRVVSKKMRYRSMINLTPCLSLCKKNDGTYYLIKTNLRSYIEPYHNNYLLQLIRPS